MSHLLHHLVFSTAARKPDAPALIHQNSTRSYAELASEVSRAGAGLVGLGLRRNERVGVFLDKRVETVVACFGTASAGGVFVPINPLLKPDQVAYILQDCNVRILVTSKQRLNLLEEELRHCQDLRAIVLAGSAPDVNDLGGRSVVYWNHVIDRGSDERTHRCIDTDMAAILYTSGSTGRPKGVVLSHRNMVAGAQSVAQYLENGPADRILSALPLSFDAGFSQLTTAFHSGASVALINYLLPRDVVGACERHSITGLTAVPPLWIQLAQLPWPDRARDALRYFANTGGRMPRTTLESLRAALPKAKPYLMYGLTEAFRSTYLPPAEVDRRPDSIGKAIPNAEIMVVRDDGSLCAPGEPGELVHRGALVSLGYWNDPEKTAERFKPTPGQPSGLVMPEIAVWSGDTVQMDDEGFLYFISRRDEMIKTSGYRVSPTEVEEVVYATGMVGEAAALGIAHPSLGQAIVVIVTSSSNATVDPDTLRAECQKRLPAYMVPTEFRVSAASLPRNPNGKIDRKTLAYELRDLFGGASE